MNTHQDAQTLDILIVGAGFAGLYMLHRARRLGLRARVVEAADGVGGTWHHNRYPGARVDIQSLEYSYGFDEALQQEWQWTERFAAQPELLAYANHVADRFALRDGIQLNTRVTGAVWDDAHQTWQVAGQAKAGAGVSVSGAAPSWQARFVVLASGPLSTPNTPVFKGLERFKGKVFHTAQWPREKVDLRGLRVGVIGTGSSGVQVIPAIAPEVKTLTVFQRTAAYSVPAHNGPLDKVFEAEVKADYAGFRARNRAMRNAFSSAYPPRNQAVMDATPAEREEQFELRWQAGGVAFMGAFSDILLNADANAVAAEFVRRKIRSIVKDTATAQMLCPTHTIGCKRLCVDTGYYETFNRPNVTLVDVSGNAGVGIEAFTETGLRANGQEHELDAIVLATGFDALTGTVMGMDLRGKGGLRIQDKWRAGPLNYLGFMTAGFPNLFNVGGPGSTAVFNNVIVSIEQQIGWISDAIAWLAVNGKTTMEATPEAEQQWVAHVNEVAQGTLFLTCSSWYLGANIPGKPRLFMPLLGYPQYARRCADVAAKGYPGFVLG